MKIPSWIKGGILALAIAITGTASGIVKNATTSSGGGAGAPTDATYITQTANSSLTNEQSMGALSTGIVKNTTTTGVQSIAVAGTDYEVPLTFSTGLTRTTNTITVNIGGSNTQVQFNNSGVLGGSAGLTWDGTNLLATNFTATTAYKIGGVSVLALPANDTGVSIGIGKSTLTNVSGANSYLTAVGTSALQADTTGLYNTAVGFQALTANTTSSTNTAVGFQALKTQTTGGGNNAFGYQALLNNLTGQSNAAIGNGALQANTSGSSNMSIGNTSLNLNTTGSNNTAIGAAALATNLDQNASTAVGAFALQHSTGTRNTAVGSNSMIAVTTGIDNTAIGTNSSDHLTTGIDNIGIGVGALSANITASYNTVIGTLAMQQVLLADNTVIGFDAGLVATSASDNTLVGYTSLIGLTTGDFNIALGEGGNITTGSSNILIGNSLAGTVATSSSQLDIGDVITGTVGATGAIAIGAPTGGVLGTAGSLNAQALSVNNVPVAVTGVDINTSNQVTATHLSSALPVNQGGSAQTSYTDGQLLIGNSSGNTLSKATITAGTGITVTNGNGTITVAASGGAAPTILSASKPSDTSRASTTTLADDPDLILSSVPAGRYAVNMTFWATSSSIVPDIKLGFIITNAPTAANGMISSLDTSGTGIVSTGEIGFSTSNSSSYAVGTNPADSVFQYQGFIIVASTSDVKIQWSQSTTSVTATVLKAGSYMSLLKTN